MKEKVFGKLTVFECFSVGIYTLCVSFASVLIQSFVARLSTALGTFWSIFLLPLSLGTFVLIVLLVLSLVSRN